MTRYEININWKKVFFLWLILSIFLAVFGAVLFIPARNHKRFQDYYIWEESYIDYYTNETVIIKRTWYFPKDFVENPMMKIAVTFIVPFTLTLISTILYFAGYLLFELLIFIRQETKGAIKITKKEVGEK